MRSIKVILNEDVYNLGEEGDVREVAPGYARNYLIPKGLAVPCTREYIAQFEDRRVAIEHRRDEKRTDALGLKERIEELSLSFQVPAGDSGKLFGSVTNATIADRLMQEGLQIERKKIEIPGHTIKMVGEYDVTIKLYADEAAKLTIAVEPEGEKPKTQRRAAKSDSKSEKPVTDVQQAAQTHDAEAAAPVDTAPVAPDESGIEATPGTEVESETKSDTELGSDTKAESEASSLGFVDDTTESAPGSQE